MNKKEYSKFLSHPLWQKKRDDIFSIYGKKCLECGSLKNCEIHHKTYSPDKMPWEYPAENFVVLCEKCHGNHHGFEYTCNKCKGCGKEISVKYSYCLPCHNKLIEEKENEKVELEHKIVHLENMLEGENKDKQSANVVEIKRLKEEKKRLVKEKNSVEKKLSKLKELDEFKQEMREKNKKIESQISSLLEAKENEKRILENRIADLEDLVKRENNKNSSHNNEINRLKKEMAQLVIEKNDVEGIQSAPKGVDQFNQAKNPDNKKIKSKVKPIIIGLLGFAAVFFLYVITFDTSVNHPPEKQIQVLASNETSNDANKKAMLPIYKIITINEVNSNVGNKVRLSEHISQVVYSRNGNVYLNIGGKFPQQKLALVIFKTNVQKFDDVSVYENKLIQIEGTLSIYDGKPQIIINEKWQLKENDELNKQIATGEKKQQDTVAHKNTIEGHNEAEWFEKGYTAYTSGKYTDALAAYSKTIELNPQCAEAYYNRGVSYAKLGKHEQAMTDLNKAFKLAPKLKPEDPEDSRNW